MLNDSYITPTHGSSDYCMEDDHVTTFHLCARRFVHVQRWDLVDQQQHAVNRAWCGLLLNTHRVMCIIVDELGGRLTLIIRYISWIPSAFKHTSASGSNLHGGT